MFRRRLIIIYCAISGVLLLICTKLFYLQALQMTSDDPDRLLRRTRPPETIPAHRGTLCDRSGAILAADQPVLNLAIGYSRLSEPEPWIADLCRATGQSPEDVRVRQRRIVNRVTRLKAEVNSVRAAKGRGPIRKLYEETIPYTLIDDIPLAAAARIEADRERYADVRIQNKHQRAFPNDAMGAHLMGYVGRATETREDGTVQLGDRIGKAGAEEQFDGLLRGTPGLVTRKADLQGGWKGIPARPGRTVFLTLDLEAQKQAELDLAGKTGAVVVMDVHNGELFVLASSPTYDNTDVRESLRLAKENPRDRIFLSRATQDSVPPGSVIKPIVALAAARAGAGRPDTTFTCTGSIVVGRTRFRCSGHHGPVAMALAIEKSCNVYFFQLALLTKPEVIANMARDLGLGRKTEVDLPNDWTGYIPDPVSERAAGRGWYAGDTLNLSIGQGESRVTPLQVAVAMAAIANGGNVLRPTVFLKATPPPDEDWPVQQTLSRKVALDARMLQAVRAGMHAAAVSGTARRVRELAALGAAVKTGTAQIGNTGMNHAWIAGYVPWDAPRFAFAVVVHRTPGHGAEVSGPIAARVLSVLLTGEAQRADATRH